MDYSTVLAEVNKASLFDLYRLMAAVNQQLDNPERIEAVKRRLKPGQEITYFDAQENRLITATVISLHRTRLLVQNKHDGERWNIRFCAVNLDQAETDIQAISGKQTFDRSEFKVGDRVGFYDRQNQERYGKIIRLNQKTVTLDCQGSKWRVSYSFLFKIIDA
ncbi:MAG: hypothetical protein QNJ46_05170 [Leptolyngbyaceae cyanobacterium MO_188.B28]|nr:hypothetical protein [Leptolyngbyaceae cyanobacterium MO_188.B28]